VYRVTPVDARSLANKNTGDPQGDLTFYFYQKLTGKANPFLSHDNLIGQFSLQVSVML
jgi:hypothetical protein